MFLHSTELNDASRVVTMVADGRNPFGEEALETLLPSQRDSVPRALCVLAAESLAEKKERWTLKPPVSAAVTLVESVQEPNVRRPLPVYLDRLEREAIVEALEETRYNRTAAANLLGITFRALRYRMERLEIDVPSGADDSEA